MLLRERSFCLKTLIPPELVAGGPFWGPVLLTIICALGRLWFRGDGFDFQAGPAGRPR